MKTATDFAAINAAFQLLSPVEKRRAIARDVLERVTTGQLTPYPQKWVSLSESGLPVGEEADLQTLLSQRPQMRCNCCAIGAAIVGLAACEDRVTVKASFIGTGVGINYAWGRGLDILERLDGLFGYDQVRVIEKAFEGGGADLKSEGCPLPLLEQALRFYESYPDDHDRFVAIWTRISNHPEALLVLP